MHSGYGTPLGALPWVRNTKAQAKANIEIYLHNPAGIGEHPDVLDAINSQIVKIAAASENIQVLQKHFVDQKVI